MSIISKLAAAKVAPKMYTVRGDLSEESPAVARVTFTKDAYALIATKYIHPDFILPLSRGEDPSGRNSKHAFKLIEGAEVELHIESLTHKFRVAQGERAFYIDDNTLEIVYLDKIKKTDCAYDCKKWVVIVDIYCCGGSFTQGGFGNVGCSDDWCDEDRCCPDRLRKGCACK